jgi:hypothetical protein
MPTISLLQPSLSPAAVLALAPAPTCQHLRGTTAEGAAVCPDCGQSFVLGDLGYRMIKKRELVALDLASAAMLLLEGFADIVSEVDSAGRDGELSAEFG